MRPSGKIALLFLLLSLGGCTTTRPKRLGDELRLKRKGAGKALTTAELIGEEDGKAPAATTGLPKAAQVERIRACQSALARWAPPYRELKEKMSPGLYPDPSQPLGQVLAAQDKDCVNRASRLALMQQLSNAVTLHSGKVGIILPLTGPRASQAAALVKGLRAAFQDAGAAFDQSVVLKDSQGNAKEAERKLADLIMVDRVALVIGGLDTEEAQLLSRWSGALAVPIVLISCVREVTAASPYAFRYYPDEMRLADTLWKGVAKRGLKRIAVLRPAGGKSDKLTSYFTALAPQHGGTVAHELVYTPGNFESMQAVVATLFNTDAARREDDYQKAYWTARKKAAAEGVPFNPRLIVLKPIVNVDAVFIPDDFRTARHFAKLFKFQLVQHLPIFGNHEWRSQALIDPWDDFFEGAFFADFVGSYASLPRSIAMPTKGSPFFIEPTAVVATDFAMIGYRAGVAARLTLQAAGTTPRTLLPRVMRTIQTIQGGAGPNKELLFDADRQGNWPTYLFRATKSGLELEAGLNPDPTSRLSTQGAGIAPTSKL